MSSNRKSSYLVLQQKFLKLVGISLSEKTSAWYNLYSLIAICTLWSYPVVIFHAALTNRYRLDILLENLAYAVAVTNACSKLMAIFYVRKELGKTLLLLESHIFVPNVKRGGEHEELLINKCTFFVNAQAMVLYGMIVVNVGLALIQTLIPRIFYDSQHWALPYGSFAAFNATYSPNFEIATLYQVTVMTMTAMGFVGATTFIAGVMAYISYQFKLLQNFIRISVVYSNKKLKQYGEGVDIIDTQSNASEIPWKYLRQTVKEIVEYHTAIIDLAGKFEQLLSMAALADFLGLSVVICLALFTCSIYSTFNLRLMNQLVLAAGNAFLQFITAYWGDQVITESEAVTRACYEADFIGADARFQKSWIAIVERSHRRIEFTVGKFAPLSLNTFLKVIQTSYSYFMMLHHFKEQKNFDI